MTYNESEPASGAKPLGEMEDLELEVAFFESLDENQRLVVSRYHKVGRGAEGTSDTILDMFAMTALVYEHSLLFSADQQDIMQVLIGRRATQTAEGVLNET